MALDVIGTGFGRTIKLVFDEDVALAMRRPGALVAIVNVGARIVSVVWTDGPEVRLATVSPFP